MFYCLEAQSAPQGKHSLFSERCPNVRRLKQTLLIFLLALCDYDLSCAAGTRLWREWWVGNGPSARRLVYPWLMGHSREATCSVKRREAFIWILAQASADAFPPRHALVGSVQLLVPRTVSDVQGLMNKMGETGMAGWLCDDQLYRTRLILTYKTAVTAF